MHPIHPASIHFNEQGTPVSDVFDDVYFSNESGLEETRYVFLAQNQLPSRWQQHPATFFHIIETGFGTGLNFLLAWAEFKAHREQYPTACCQRLYFSSFEKYPLRQADLALALQRWPSLTVEAELLLAQYPTPLPGCHRLLFENGAVVLDLWLGDVHNSMPQLTEHHRADAWFLDGFAPSKNPEMWQPALFSQMARLSKPECTVATFTSAGIVRRGLQQAGFVVQKVKGFGRKREMTIGQFQGGNENDHHSNIHSDHYTDHHSNNPTDTDEKAVTIIGGGLASFCLALALHRRGWSIELLCQDDTVAQQASHNRQGALYPQLQAQYNRPSALHLQAFGYACRFFQTARQLFSFPADFCGVLTLACSPQLAKRQQKIQLDPTLNQAGFHVVDAHTASQLAGIELPYEGIFFPQGGWIAPQQFCQAAAQYLSQQSNFKLIAQCHINALHENVATKNWHIDSSQGLLSRRQVILANGVGVTKFAVTKHLPINQVRGQVTHVASASMTPLKTVICHQGYITPALEQLHCVGATFDRSRQEPIELAADNEANLALVNQVLEQPNWFSDAQVDSAKAGVRATVPDHLPIAGYVAPSLRILAGLGARGLLFAPLLAEHLAAEMSVEPSPLIEEMQQLVAPSRF